jgi:hypothetical protein
MVLEGRKDHSRYGDRPSARCRFRIAREQLACGQARYRPPDGHRTGEQVDITATQSEDLAFAQ